MKQGARELAVEALVRVEKGGAYSNLLLNQLFKSQAKLDPRDKGLITQLVYGTLQHQRLLDFYLQPFLKQDLTQLENWLKQLLRVSVYQFLFLERVPNHAVVHEAVEIAKKRGHRGISSLVNAVLRNFLRSSSESREKLLTSIADPVERLAIETSHPTWLVRRWVEQLGLESTKAMCAENNQAPKMTVRVNQLKATRAEVSRMLEDQGYRVAETTQAEAGLIIHSSSQQDHLGSIAASPLFKEGYLTIQDESSMLIAPLLDVHSGMKVLDACAAPGGKTTHLAELMHNSGEIMAVDLHAHKQNLIQANAERLGLTIIKTKEADARKLAEHLSRSSLEEEGIFDRILLDAPCSGFGVIRRKPDLKWKKKEEDIEQIAKTQYELLTSVSKWLKKAGQLVYSTCTIDQTENEKLIERFIEEHPHFSIVPGSKQRILPQDFGSDGFFMIKLERNR